MVNLVKGLPEGWNEVNGIVRSQELDAGRLSLLLKDELKDRLRFNLLTLKPELDGIELPDTDITYLYVKMGECGWKVAKTSAIDAIIYASQKNCYDPVQEYLLDLEQQKKDLKLYEADIDSIATDYLKVDDELSNKMVKNWLVGQVRRAFHRGIKHDTMLVLHGEQELRKSSFFSALMPKAEWFSDTPTTDAKDRLMIIQSSWCYEIAELENLTSKNEAGKVKALLSSSYDTFRPPYGHALIKSPRPSLLVGTANSTELLNDETGHRRFNFVRVTEPINIEQVTNDRDSIWLSAVLAYREGYIPILDKAESQLSESRSSEYEKENVFFDLVQEYLETAPDYFTTRQLFLGTKLITPYESPKQLDAVQVGKALTALGYEKRQMRVNKVRGRYWHKKGTQGKVPSVPSSEDDDVTADSTAIDSDSGNCPNVTTQNKEVNQRENQPHKAIRWDSCEDVVTAKKTFTNVVVGYNSTSQPKMSQEEREKEDKELDEFWKTP